MMLGVIVDMTYDKVRDMTTLFIGEGLLDVKLKLNFKVGKWLK